MDYNKYDYNGREYDLSQAVEFMQKGKWQKALRTIERTTHCSQTEAEHIALKIKDSLPDGDKIKQKERIGSKFMLLVVLAALAVGGYFAYGYFITDPQNYAMEEKDSSIETEYIGDVGEFVWSLDEFGKDETRQNARRLFDMMKNDKGQFFLYRDYAGDKFDMDSTEYAESLFRTNKAYLDVATEEYDYQPQLTTDFVSTKFGRLVKNYLNSNCTKVTYDGFRIEDDDPEGFNSASEIQAYNNKYIFNGKTPEEYFTSKNLDITCNNVEIKKLGLAPSNTYYFAICEAEVTTNTCDGGSMFPEAGETGTVTVNVIATCEMKTLSTYQLVVDHISIKEN